MNSRPEPPSRDEWIDYLRGALTESHSLQIENYINENGLPVEFSQISAESIDDSLVNQLRKQGSRQVESPVQKEALKAARAVNANPRQVGRLIEFFSDLRGSLTTVSSIEVSEIGHYRLLANVSRSRMGRVYRGINQLTGEKVALKFPPEFISESTLDRFHREIAVTRQLKHPRIVTAVDELQFRGLPVYVMPWVEGIDLGRVVRANGRLTEAESASIGVAVVEILKYLAEKGVVHRDIKPSNLMLTPSGEIVLIDLGLAILNNSEITDGTFTESLQIIGTMDYLAPEQARDAHSADFRADIYSLGCTLCKLASGMAPYEKATGQHALQIIVAHSLDPFPNLHEKYNDISIEFVELLKEMCAKLLPDRVKDYDELVERLKKLAAGADLLELYLKQTEIQEPPAGLHLPVSLEKPGKINLSKVRRRNAIAMGLVGATALGLFQQERLKALINRAGGLFQRPTDFLFAEKPKKWLDPHSVFIMDGNLRSIHVIDPDSNYQVTGFTPPFSGSNLAITRSGLMFGATLQGRIRKVDLRANIGIDYPNLVLDQDLNDSRGNGSGGMVYRDAKSLFVTGKISGRLYKIDTTIMEFDRSFGENGFVKVGEFAFGVDHDPEGNLYVACHTGITKVSQDGKTVDPNFISGLTRATAVGGFNYVLRDNIFVADGYQIKQFSKEGKLINDNYIRWGHGIDHILVDQSLDLIYLSSYAYISYIDIYKFGASGIFFRRVPEVGMNLAQMTIPVPD